MGKGKGGRRGLEARVWAGTRLLAFSTIRLGLMASLRRRLQVRSNFLIGSSSDARLGSLTGGFVGLAPAWVGSQRLQPAYIAQRFGEFREQLQRLRRPFL